MGIILSGVSYRYRNQQFLFEGLDLSVAAGAKVSLVGDKETRGIGSKVIELLPEQIVAAQSAEIDGIANRQACMVTVAPGMRIARQHGARAARP